MIKKQEGMTGISIIMILCFVVFVITLLIKVVPVYVDDASIKSIVKSFDGKLEMRGKNKKDVLATFKKRLRINNLSMLDDDAITITKNDGDFTLVVEYEPRGELVGSLEYIVLFHHEATFPAR